MPAAIPELAMFVSDVLRDYPQSLRVFIKHRMLCVGCYVAPFHTIDDACLEHDIDPELFLRELTLAMNEDQPRPPLNSTS